MSKMKNYYKILQIDPSAEQDVIEAAFKRLAAKYHPDVNKSADATQRMQDINEAHDVLKDKYKRAEYDQEFGFDFSESDNDPDSIGQRRKERSTAKNGHEQEEGWTGKKEEASDKYKNEQPEAEQNRNRENDQSRKEQAAEEQERNLNNLQKESRQQRRILAVVLGLLSCLSVAVVINVASYIFKLPDFSFQQEISSTQVISITQIVPVTQIDLSTVEVTQVIPITQVSPATIEVTQIIPSTQIIQITQVIPVTQVAPVTQVLPTASAIPSPAYTQTPKYINAPPVFIYPQDGQELGYDGSFLFKVTSVNGAIDYLWAFFQNDIMVWANIRDDGKYSGPEYGIPIDSVAHSKFQRGQVVVKVSANINGEWTKAATITIILK